MEQSTQAITLTEAIFRGAEAVALIMVGLMIVETIYDYFTKRRTSLYETFANVFIDVGNIILERTIVGATFLAGLYAASQFALYEIPINAGTWALVIVAVDFCYYWMHRIEHRVRLLWAVHSVHHSSPEFNLTTSLRLSWVESLYEWLFFAPLVLIGFDLLQVLGGLFLVLVYQSWIHTEKIGKLGWLDGVFNTPSTHRVHHGTNRTYLDKNFGGVLIIWDRLFGTYQPEGAKARYGVTEPLGTSNPFVINFYEFYAIFRDVWRAKRAQEAIGYVLRPPGWRPASAKKVETERRPQQDTSQSSP